MAKQNIFSDAQLAQVGKLAGGFVDERIDAVINEIEERLMAASKPPLGSGDANQIIWDRDTVKGVVGRILGVAYFKGHADAKEGIQPRSSLFIPR